jgi:hypothetical protein
MPSPSVSSQPRLQRHAVQGHCDVNGVSLYFELVTLTNHANARRFSSSQSSPPPLSPPQTSPPAACPHSPSASSASASASSSSPPPPPPPTSSSPHTDSMSACPFLASSFTNDTTNDVTFVLTPGGQFGATVAKDLRDRFERAVSLESSSSSAASSAEGAPGVASGWYRTHLLTWDRRNTGRSSFGYDTSAPVLLDEVADLLALLRALRLPNVHLYGFSSGSRVSLRLAVDHPDAVRSVVACPPTGGLGAAKVVSNMYYMQYVPLAQKGGMEAVAATDFFTEHLRENPHHAAALRQTDPAHFAVRRRSL